VNQVLPETEHSITTIIMPMSSTPTDHDEEHQSVAPVAPPSLSSSQSVSPARAPASASASAPAPQPTPPPVTMRFPPTPWPLHVNFNTHTDNDKDRNHEHGQDGKTDQQHESIRFTLRMMTDAEGESTVRSVRDLLLEYIASLGIDMTFQNVDEELAILPGERYSPQHGGALLLLYADKQEDSNNNECKHPSCSCGSTQPASDLTSPSHSTIAASPTAAANAPSPSPTPSHPCSCCSSCPTQCPSSSLVGCVGLKSLGDGISEAKRLFIRPTYRGRDLGRLLLVQAIELAKWIGYHTIRLDTLGRFTAANALYASLGFVRIPPYNYNPQPDVLYFEIANLQGKCQHTGNSSNSMVDDFRVGREDAFQPRPRWKGVKKVGRKGRNGNNNNDTVTVSSDH